MAYNSRRLDFCSKEGAELLAERIRKYWEKRGVDCAVWVEKIDADGQSKMVEFDAPVWVVRSTLRIRGRK
jgi:translation elongation factor EF-G